MANNGFVLRNEQKGQFLGAVKLHCLSSDNNFALKFFDAFILSGCSENWAIRFYKIFKKDNKDKKKIGQESTLC